MSTLTALGGTASSAQADTYNGPTLKSDTVTLLNQPSSPSYFVRDDATNYDVRYTEPGIIAAQYGHGQNTDTDQYEISPAYQNQPLSATDVKFHAVGDLNGDDDVDVALASGTGSRTISVLGSHAASFPALDTLTLDSSQGSVTGLVILGDPATDIANTKQDTAERLVVLTTTGLYVYAWNVADSGLEQVASDTAGISLGTSGATVPYANVVDVYHRPFWDKYDSEDPAANDDSGQSTSAVNHSFALLYVRDGHVRAVMATLNAVDNTITAGNDHSLGLSSTDITPADVVAGRVNYVYTVQNDTDNFRDRSWLNAVVYFKSAPHTGKVALNIGTSTEQPTQTCDTDLDTSDPANVPDLLGASVRSMDVPVEVCEGVDQQPSGPDKLRTAEFVQDISSSVAEEPVPGYDTLQQPQAQLELPEQWIEDGKWSQAGDHTVTPSDDKLTVSTLLRGTPTSGSTSTVLVSQSFDYQDPSEDSSPEAFTLFSQWAHPVAAKDAGSGPLVFARLPHIRNSVTIKVDDRTKPQRVIGQPVPLAVLAAPPTVSGAGQDGSAPTFEKTKGESTSTGSTESSHVGASAGVDWESPLGAYGVSVTASIEQEIETSYTETKDVTFSDTYSGSMSDDTLVYQTTPQWVFPGTVIASTTGVGVGSRSFVSVPDGQGATISSATLGSLAGRYGDDNSPVGNLFGPGGYFTGGIADVLSHGTTRQQVGNPGSYMTYGTAGAAVDDYCLGSLDGSTEDDLPAGPDLGLNPFLSNPTPPQKPDILISADHLVQAGTPNQEGAGFAIESGQEHGRVANTTVDVAVTGRVNYISAGVNGGYGWGEDYTHSLTQGVGYTAGIGNIPDSALQNETYDWRMFLCTKNLRTADGHAYPIQVLNYTVDHYQGSGGLEPLGPITDVTPRESNYTGLTPTLSWEQDSGTVKDYTWQVEAVGTNDVRSGDISYKDTVDSTQNRPDVSTVTLTTPLKQNQLYRWRVTSTDFFGNTQASTWEYFVTEGKPDADFGFTPTEPDMRDTVTFTDTSDHGGLPTTAHWTFDDGTVATGSSVTKQFTTSGAHTVTLRVSNSAGDDQLTKIVPVIVGPQDDTYAATEDTTLDVDAAHGVLTNDSAPGSLTATVDQQPAAGTLTLNTDGSFSYVPDANYCGPDGFSYKLEDGSGQTHEATVAIDVSCVNDAPTASDQQFNVTEDAAQHVAAPGLLGGLIDPDIGDTHTATLVSQPTHGRVTASSDGSFTYTPNKNYCGSDSFDYRASDGDGAQSNTATVSLDVACVNDVPVAADDDYRVDPDTTLTKDAAQGVLSNDTDVEDGLASVATLDQGPTNGTLTLNPDGSFEYTPNTGFSGSDSFSYKPGDKDGGTSPVAATVSITVGHPSPPPSGGGGGGGSTPGNGVPTPVQPGGTVSSNPDATNPSPSDPVIVTVTSPNQGEVSFTPASDPTAPGSYAPIYAATITAPAATASDPLVLTFHIDASALPSGVPPEQVTMFRDGTAIPECTSTDATATPDPCVSGRTFTHGVLTVTVLSSHASDWVAGIAPLVRVAGQNRIETAVAASRSAFPDDKSAGAVVLARSDDYADALVGGPLAAAKHGPLLLTGSNGLANAAAAELQRVLPAGARVYLLGGTHAISSQVANRVQQLGYSVTRYGGANRYATATQVAVKGLGSPSTVFEATGTSFADALSAGPAAAAQHAAILLTRGTQQADATASYLQAHHPTRFAVGGPAAKADSTATPLVGSNRYATAVQVARRFFPHPAQLAFASGVGYADALSGGAAAANLGASMLLVPSTGTLGTAVSGYLDAAASTVGTSLLYGGPAAVSGHVADQLTTRLVG